jgi:hypothetical protein
MRILTDHGFDRGGGSNRSVEKNKITPECLTAPPNLFARSDWRSSQWGCTIAGRRCGARQAISALLGLRGIVSYARSMPMDDIKMSSNPAKPLPTNPQERLHTPKPRQNRVIAGT